MSNNVVIYFKAIICKCSMDKTRDLISEFMTKYSPVVIDLEDMTNISPTLAYIVFGKLYDEHKSRCENLVFINDKFNFKERILKAIDIRSKVVELEMKELQEFTKYE